MEHRVRIQLERLRELTRELERARCFMLRPDLLSQEDIHMKEALSFVLAGGVKLAGSYLPPLCAVGADSVACLNAIADPQAMQVMLSALFAHVLHASQQKETTG